MDEANELGWALCLPVKSGHRVVRRWSFGTRSAGFLHGLEPASDLSRTRIRQGADPFQLAGVLPGFGPGGNNRDHGAHFAGRGARGVEKLQEFRPDRPLESLGDLAGILCQARPKEREDFVRSFKGMNAGNLLGQDWGVTSYALTSGKLQFESMIPSVPARVSK